MYGVRKYRSKISHLKEEVVSNYYSMKEMEDKEQELISRLKSTYTEMEQTENAIKTLEKGNSCDSRSLYKGYANKRMRYMFDYGCMFLLERGHKFNHNFPIVTFI
jgi:SMC interacting uncharacterized protein involved in chromosome segregation